VIFLKATRSFHEAVLAVANDLPKMDFSYEAHGRTSVTVADCGT
jgi:hypothetical protein